MVATPLSSESLLDGFGITNDMESTIIRKTHWIQGPSLPPVVSHEYGLVNQSRFRDPKFNCSKQSITGTIKNKGGYVGFLHFKLLARLLVISLVISTSRNQKINL